ncbi:uncharacterized protein LOC119670045 [Teleopsis dalmanni]|uniref:uncharacterized protein LOC119670045 n=1 Tax=Teleopsis dalmanni TaxID=139649 RepID=UPI0018CF9F4F|nr:uncharacterized protein LOC119670045 [Teleopsis dalmanni]
METSYVHDYGWPCPHGYRPRRKLTRFPPVNIEKYRDIEWTGNAPMGRLVERQNIPIREVDEETKKFDLDDQKRQLFEIEDMNATLIEQMAEYNRCGKVHNIKSPAEFVDIMAKVYPELYIRLKLMLRDDYLRRFSRPRYKTSYQMQFGDDKCEGPFEEEMDVQKHAKALEADSSHKAKVLREILCHPYKIPRCGRPYQEFYTALEAAKRPKLEPEEDINKGYLVTEYMDTINKVACVIIRNKLNSHKRCGKNCIHEIHQPCDRFKFNLALMKKARKPIKVDYCT